MKSAPFPQPKDARTAKTPSDMDLVDALNTGKRGVSSYTARNAILLLCFLSICIKLLYVVSAPSQGISPDEYSYLAFAHNLQTTGKLGGTSRGVGYPAFLAAIMSLVPGSSLTPVRFVQALLLGILPFLVWRETVPIFGGRVAFGAALLVAFYPPFIFYSAKFLTEALLTVLLTLALAFYVAFLKQRSTLYALTSGALFATATLTRTEFLLLPLLHLGVTALGARNGAPLLRGVGVFLLAFMLVLAAGLARNYREFQRIYLSTDFGQTAWLSTHPEDWQEWREHEILTQTDRLSPWERDRALLLVAIENLRKDPGTYLTMCVKRFFRFWIGSHSNTVAGLEMGFMEAWNDRQYGPFILKGLLLSVNLLLLGLAAYGLVSASGSWRAWLTVSVPFIYIALVHTLLFSTPRYQIPIMPQVLIFSAVGFLAWRHGAHAVLPGEMQRPS